ncbi:hypothetical protein SLNSH_24110 [Alsobacter soli]|uniref:Uncharacterized protein n=1 Tax=Alsobacter soli TaxID=2109933 RepID=A0A2T1HLH6_9HYPH|nr:hypothetical protein [Alsobacter soli]PSC02441.1 hypothetical protein SLNSH_24110 [Alsobacter soli]
MKPLWRFGLLASFLCGVGFAPASAAAKECAWGQPGYRACVEGKLHSRRESASRGEKRVYKTAPARKRPGTLTPVPPAPTPEMPRQDFGVRRHAPSQEHRLDAINRQNIERDRTPNLILPPDPIHQNTVPGRICPPIGGC